jgi:hypothetical protein
MATWTFRTPSVDEGPASWDNRLFYRVKLARGISILEGPPGTYRAARFPTQDEIAASQPHMYMGGHEYEVDDATKAALIAAGIGVTEANFSNPIGLFPYGAGPYGVGPYGG